MLKNLKQGDVLIDQKMNRIKILGVCGEVYFPSELNDFKKAYGIVFTVEEIVGRGFTLEPKKPKKYVPENGEQYFYFDSFGEETSYTWGGESEADTFRLSIGNVHRTSEDVQKYKEALQKWAEGRE